MNWDYPRVMDEITTVDRLVKGDYRGIARYGDGDFNIMRGQRDRYHAPCPKLARNLAETLHRGSNHVLNALIPPPLGPSQELAYQRWLMYLDANAGIIPFLADETYGSSNISRMDSCPHLHTRQWWDHVSQLWNDRDISLVWGTERSLTPKKLMESPNAPRSIKEIPCLEKDNYKQLDELFQAVLKARKEHVILCSGLVTRPLVHKLVGAGLCAYDIGHLGLWFRGGEPIPLPDCPR